MWCKNGVENPRQKFDFPATVDMDSWHMHGLVVDRCLNGPMVVGGRRMVDVVNNHMVLRDLGHQKSGVLQSNIKKKKKKHFSVETFGLGWLVSQLKGWCFNFLTDL